MALAFPGQTGSMVEITAIDAFVESFGDRGLRKSYRRRATLSKALTWAIHIEANDDSGTPDGPTSFDCEGHRKDYPSRVDEFHLGLEEARCVSRELLRPPRRVIYERVEPPSYEARSTELACGVSERPMVRRGALAYMACERS